MASSNLEVDVKREESLISTRDHNSLYDNQILLPASRPLLVENVGTLIMGNSVNEDEATKHNEPNPIDWDELIHSETWQTVERQVIEELQHAQPGSSSVEDVIGALKALLTISGEFDGPKQYIISLVLDTLPKHPQNVNVQIWGLQVLHCLNKRLQQFDMYECTRIEILKETLHTAARFENDAKLQQIALKIMADLCRCLATSPLNKTDYWWDSIIVAMNALCVFDDKLIHQTSLKYLSKLLRVLPTGIHTIASTKRFRERLYQILVEKYQTQTADDDLSIVLDLWKEITYSKDYRNCFIIESKLHILVQLLELFVARDPIVVEKVLALMEQIGRHTDVSYDSIMTKDLVMQLLNLVGNEHLPISFLSATILVNHVGYKLRVEKFNEELMPKIYRVIKSAVYKWDSTYESEVIKLESLKPLINLLLDRESALKLYAAWTINHLSVHNPKFYAARLFEEKLMTTLESFKNQPRNECSEIELYVNSALTNFHNVRDDQSSSRRNLPKYSLGHIVSIIINESQYADEAQQLKSEAAQIGQENGAQSFPGRSGFGKILCDYFEETSTNFHPSSDVRKSMKALFHTANLAECFVNEFDKEKTIHNALEVIHGFAENILEHKNPYIVDKILTLIPLVLAFVNNLLEDLGPKKN